MADSKQTSHGFNFADLSTYPQRNVRSAEDEDIEAQIFALPWTVVRQYNVRHPNVKWQRKPVGGEVWIQYPVRTLWQEIATVYVLSDLQLAQQFGLGANRADVTRKFVAPHKTNLRPLAESQMSLRPRWPGASRPGETLLSLAIGTTQPYPNVFGSGQSRAWDDWAWSGANLGETIGLRLLRAVSIVTLSRRMGAHLILPNGDYHVTFGRRPFKVFGQSVTSTFSLLF